jgi:hypothetical protein
MVEEVDVSWGRCLRVRIHLDVTRPLERERALVLSSKSIWVPFQYEKLPQFCHGCGRIYHGSIACLALGGSPSEIMANKPWGVWLRADDHRYRSGGLVRSQGGSSTVIGASSSTRPPPSAVGGEVTLFTGSTNTVPMIKEVALNPPTSKAVDSSCAVISGFKGKVVDSKIRVGDDSNVRGLHVVETFKDTTCPLLSKCLDESVEQPLKSKELDVVHDTSVLADTGILTKTSLDGLRGELVSSHAALVLDVSTLTLVDIPLSQNVDCLENYVFKSTSSTGKVRGSFVRRGKKKGTNVSASPRQSVAGKRKDIVDSKIPHAQGDLTKKWRFLGVSPSSLALAAADIQPRHPQRVS